MRYYECNGNLYTSNIPINNNEFIEITKDEYELKLNNIIVKYIPPSIENGDNVDIIDGDGWDNINIIDGDNWDNVDIIEGDIIIND